MKQFNKHFYLLIFIGLTIVLSFLLGACGRIQAGQTEEETEVKIDLAVEPDQPAVGPSQLVITLTDQAGQPIDNATLEVEGNMTHAGMVPVLAKASTGEEGRYVVPFEWTMGGDWIVTIEVTLPDGQEVSQEFPVTVR